MEENKIITKSAWSLNCREATYLTELSKEGRLSMMLRARLWYHLTICESCKNFKKQTLLLAAKLKELGNSEKKSFNSHSLESSDKELLQAKINKALEKKS